MICFYYLFLLGNKIYYIALLRVTQNAYEIKYTISRFTFIYLLKYKHRKITFFNNQYDKQ